MTDSSPMSDHLSRLLELEHPAELEVETTSAGPTGSLPLTDEMLRTWSSGDLFGLTQSAGMGCAPTQL